MVDYTLKICSKCRESKTRDQFSSDPSNKDGLYPRCKACKAEDRRVRYKPAVKRSISECFWTHVDKSQGDGECWTWTAGTVEGYGTLRYRTRKYKAHRVSYEINVGPIPDGLWVLHTCDNPICVNPRHLFLGTVQDNNRDKMQKGRHRAPKGEEHPHHILTEDKVRQIRQMWQTGNYTQIEIGHVVGMSNVTVSQVVRGDTWKHVK